MDRWVDVFLTAEVLSVPASTIVLVLLAAAAFGHEQMRPVCNWVWAGLTTMLVALAKGSIPEGVLPFGPMVAWVPIGCLFVIAGAIAVLNELDGAAGTWRRKRASRGQPQNMNERDGR
ncbi:hypothetical protein [Ottowia sp.]|uniref:hypothetical protein n=1 Tax=Ottowia sp. TaxID=1898956 RepID=UPI0025F482F2|nr:hypothetical protein [Ottowia sp.]MBK6616225.1 hypothetical protein [Ottowia sp.]